MRIDPAIVGKLVKGALAAAPELCEALDPESPGGRKVTGEEAVEIGIAFAQALAEAHGDAGAARIVDEIAYEVRERGRG